MHCVRYRYHISENMQRLYQGPYWKEVQVGYGWMKLTVKDMRILSVSVDTETGA